MKNEISIFTEASVLKREQKHALVKRMKEEGLHVAIISDDKGQEYVKKMFPLVLNEVANFYGSEHLNAGTLVDIILSEFPTLSQEQIMEFGKTLMTGRIRHADGIDNYPKLKYKLTSAYVLECMGIYSMGLAANREAQHEVIKNDLSRINIMDALEKVDKEWTDSLRRDALNLDCSYFDFFTSGDKIVSNEADVLKVFEWVFKGTTINVVQKAIDSFGTFTPLKMTLIIILERYKQCPPIHIIMNEWKENVDKLSVHEIVDISILKKYLYYREHTPIISNSLMAKRYKKDLLTYNKQKENENK